MPVSLTEPLRFLPQILLILSREQGAFWEGKARSRCFYVLYFSGHTAQARLWSIVLLLTGDLLLFGFMIKEFFTQHGKM